METVKVSLLTNNDVIQIPGKEGLFWIDASDEVRYATRRSRNVKIMLEDEQSVQRIAKAESLAAAFIRRAENQQQIEPLFEYRFHPNDIYHLSRSEKINGSVIRLDGDPRLFIIRRSGNHTELYRPDEDSATPLQGDSAIEMIAYIVDLACDFIRTQEPQDEASQNPLTTALSHHIIEAEKPAPFVKTSQITEGSVFRLPPENGLFYFVTQLGYQHGQRQYSRNRVLLDWIDEVEVIADGVDLAKEYIRKLEAIEGRNQLFEYIEDPEQDEYCPLAFCQAKRGSVIRVSGKKGLFYITKTKYFPVAHRWNRSRPVRLNYDRVIQVLATFEDLAENYISQTCDTNLRENIMGPPWNLPILVSGCVIQISGEEGLFYTDTCYDIYRYASRWDNRSIFDLNLDKDVKTVITSKELAMMYIRQLIQDPFLERRQGTFAGPPSQPSVIRLSGEDIPSYLEPGVKGDNQGKDYLFRLGQDEFTFLAFNSTGQTLAYTDCLASAYIERIEAKSQLQQKTLHWKACALSSGDVIRIPGETGLCYMRMSYCGQFAHQQDHSTVFDLQGCQEVELVAEMSALASQSLSEFECSPESRPNGIVGTPKNNGSLIRLPGRDELFTLTVHLYEQPYALHASGERIDLDWDQEVEVIADGYELAKRYIRRVEASKS